MKIYWSPRALNEYLAVLDYLQKEWGANVVQSFSERVTDVLNLIVTNPSIFNASQKKKDIRRCVLRRLISLYYRIKNQEIELVAFIDNRTNPKATKL